MKELIISEENEIKALCGLTPKSEWLSKRLRKIEKAIERFTAFTYVHPVAKSKENGIIGYLEIEKKRLQEELTDTNNCFAFNPDSEVIAIKDEEPKKVDYTISLPITQDRSGGFATLTMSEEDYRKIILEEGYHLKFIKNQSTTHEKVADELSQAHTRLRGDTPDEYDIHIDIPYNLPITLNQSGGFAMLRIKQKDFEEIILNGSYEFKFVKKDESNHDIEPLIDIPNVIRNVLYLARVKKNKVIESCYLTPNLYGIFIKVMGFKETNTRSCQFEGINIINDPKELFMRFTYRGEKVFTLGLDKDSRVVAAGTLLIDADYASLDGANYLEGKNVFDIRKIIKVREVMDEA